MQLWEKRVSLAQLERWEEQVESIASGQWLLIQKPKACFALLQICHPTSKQLSTLKKLWGGTVKKLNPTKDKLSVISKKIAGTFLVTSAPVSQSHLIPLLILQGMAFGTGDHATTAMCLRQIALRKNLLLGKQILDVGTGTGILALGASALGAKVQAFDYDADAVRVAKENSKLNPHIPPVRWSCCSVESFTLKKPFDVVVANLYAEILCKYPTFFQQAVAPDGVLILSGILTEQESHVIKTFSKAWKVLERLRKGKWVCLVLEKS